MPEPRTGDVLRMEIKAMRRWSQRQTALALENAPVGASSAAFTTRYGLGSASSVQRAAKGLKVRDVIERDAKRYFIIDRFLKIWLRKRVAA